MAAFHLCLVHHVCDVCYVSVAFIILFMQAKINNNAKKCEENAVFSHIGKM